MSEDDMRQFVAWVLAAALILVGASASAQPAQNRVETPAGALSLPAEPPLTIAALDAAGELVNGTAGWRAPNLEEGASLMERAGAARERAAREARRHHPHQERVTAGRQQALSLYWQAHRVLQSPGSLYQYAQAALAAGHGEVACAILAFLANRGGYQGMSADNLREQMSNVASCQPDWRLPERPVTPAVSPDPDGDGVSNGDDVCPNEAAGAHPDTIRLGCPATDPDNDSVYGADDHCPNAVPGPNPDPARRGCPRPNQVVVTPPVPSFQLVPRSGVHNIAPWVLLGTGVATLAAGTWQAVEFNACNGRIAANMGLQLGDRSCSENSALRANIAFGIGGALTVAGGLWLALRPPPMRQVPAAPVRVTSVRAMLDPTLGVSGLVVGGTFNVF